MTDAYLRFDHPNVGYVIDGEEDATVRYAFDRDLEPGQKVKLLTPGGNVFGYARIEDVWTCPLRLAYIDMTVTDGRSHPAKDTAELHDRLEDHYPDAELTGETEVTLIYFNLIQVGGPR